MSTSYANPGGTGDRRRMIVVTSSGILTTETSAQLHVNGSTSDASADSPFTGGSASGAWIDYDFGTDQYVIDEVTWKQDGVENNGTWKWTGSNDGSSWADLSSSFTLGGATSSTHSLAGNTTAYKRYRLTGVSGTTNAGSRPQEVEFKISTMTGRTNGTSYTDPQGSGDRRTSNVVTITSGGSPWISGTPSLLVDGSYTVDAVRWQPSGAVADKWVKFDFGADKLVDEACYYQSLVAGQGTWKWQGSSNDSDWTDIGGSFSLSTVVATNLRTLNGNSTAYRYYRIYGVSGNTSSTPRGREFEFRIGNPPAPGGDKPTGPFPTFRPDLP